MTAETDPLTLLARDGSEDEVREQLAKGLPADGGADALWAAAAWLRISVVRILLDGGVSVHAATVGDRSTVLHGAFKYGHSSAACEIVELVLARGADIDAVDSIARSALHNAAWQAHVEVVQFLLQRGASQDLRDHSGRTPLELVTSRDYNDFCAIFDNRRPSEADYREVERLLREAADAELDDW